MSTSEVIAANVRARMAWAGISANEMYEAMGWSRRTGYNKLHAITSLTTAEVEHLAEQLGCEPGDLFKIPESFSSPSGDPNAALAAMAA